LFLVILQCLTGYSSRTRNSWLVGWESAGCYVQSFRRICFWKNTSFDSVSFPPFLKCMLLSQRTYFLHYLKLSTTYVHVCKRSYKEAPRNSVYLFKHQGNLLLFKTCCMISVLFSTKFRLFRNFISFYSNNTFFISHALKFM
jgi:hypothetical protein